MVRQIIEYVTQGDADICFSDYARQHIDRMVQKKCFNVLRKFVKALYGEKTGISLCLMRLNRVCDIAIAMLSSKRRWSMQ